VIVEITVFNEQRNVWKNCGERVVSESDGASRIRAKLNKTKQHKRESTMFGGE